MDFKKVYPKQDPNKAVSGVWMPMSATFEVLVAKANNPRFLAVSKEVMRPHRVAAQRGAVSEDEITRLTCEVIAKTLLLNWRGAAVMPDKSAVGEYSPERAQELLMQFEGFREDITAMSSDKANFTDDAVEAELKNSKTTSSGDSSGESISA